MKRDYRELRELANAFHDRFSELNYDTSMSLTQKFNILLEYFKNIAKDWEDVLDYLEEFEKNFDENLYKTVSDILVRWLEDGTLADIIAELVVKQGDLSIFRPQDKTVMEKIKNQFNSEYQDVTWHGAIGDGVNDDLIAFQKAHDALPETGGKIYVPRPIKNWTFKSENPTYPHKQLVIWKNNVTLEFENNGSVDLLNGVVTTVSHDSIIYLPKDVRDFRMVNGMLDCNSRNKNGILSDGFVSRITLDNVRVFRAFEDGFKIIGWLITLIRCEAHSSNSYGYYILGETNTRAQGTSILFLNCYAVNNKIGGYLTQLLTYSSFISCAVDGSPIGYQLVENKGVTLISCGSERCERPFIVQKSDGVSLDGCSIPVSVAGANLIELNDSVNVTIKGLNFGAGGFAYKLKMTGASNSVVLDNTITSSQVLNQSTLEKPFYTVLNKLDLTPKSLIPQPMVTNWGGSIVQTKNDIGMTTLIGDIIYSSEAASDPAPLSVITTLVEPLRPLSNMVIPLLSKNTGKFSGYLYIAITDGTLRISSDTTLSKGVNYTFQHTYYSRY